jgi:heme oxygenase
VLLSHRLRAETKDLHAAAERSGVMARLLRGELSREMYLDLIENLKELYRALEDELVRNRAHPSLEWMDLGALTRAGRLDADIAGLRTPADAAAAPRPATREYVERIHTCGREAPQLLIAHAYVRYLGDLSGGQILRSIVSRMLGTAGQDGTSFYEFPEIADVDAFKRRFRANLDATADADAAQRIVDEAKNSFILHARLFKELETAEQ